jgi:hypothetical protein
VIISPRYYDVFLHGWPRLCPKQLASAVVDNHYTFRYKNVHSGEEFELVLESVHLVAEVRPNEERVAKIRLKFY